MIKKAAKPPKPFRVSRWPRGTLILFLERLELYVSSGLALDTALRTAEEGVPAKQKTVIEKVRRSVESGGSLSRSLSQYLKIPETTVGLIRHGESGGGLASALAAARAMLEREDELRKKCLSAMAYPIVIGVFASLLTIGLVRGVMPQIIPMLKGLHVALPLLTRIVMALSDGLIAYGLYIGLGSLASAIIFWNLYRRVKAFKRIFQNVLIRAPLIGKLVYSYSLSVFLGSCGTLTQSGMPISASYAATVETISLLPLKSSLIMKNTEVSRGVRLGSVLLGLKRIPSYIAPLVSAGESSGTLGSSLIRAAAIIDRDIEHALKKLTSLIEPIMMAGMGGVVGAIALSIMMPIYDISKVLQH